MTVEGALKLMENFGISALILIGIWKLADKWAGKFLEAQTKQAEAMGELASAVRDGQGEQREVLVAVRALAVQVERMNERIGGRE